MLTKEEANKRMEGHIEASLNNLAEAQRLADEYGLSFTFEVPNHYGLQDTYVGMALDKERDATRTWKVWDTKYDTMEDLESYYNGWQSSSAQC